MCTCHTHIFSVKNTPCCVWSTSCASSFCEWLTCSGTSMAEGSLPQIWLWYSFLTRGLQWSARQWITEHHFTANFPLSPSKYRKRAYNELKIALHVLYNSLGSDTPLRTEASKSWDFPCHQKQGENELWDDNVIEINMTLVRAHAHCPTWNSWCSERCTKKKRRERQKQGITDWN